MAVDTAIASVEDRLAAADVVNRFFYLVDHGRAAENAGLFTANATLTFAPGAPKPGTVQGADIPAAMAARQAQAGVTTRHVLSNVAVTAQPDGSMAVYSLLTLFRAEGETRDSLPASIADVEDVLVRTDGGWKIQARLITPIFNRLA